jgi:DegV family protein with EDD domain
MVQIVADTTCSLPHDLLKRRGIPLLPQIIIFGERAYRDDSEIDTATFLQKLKAAHDLPKTAAPPPQLYTPVFEEASRKGEAVIVVAPSSKVSGTVRSAEVAAQDFPEADIRVVDTQAVAGNLGTLVLLADQWAKEGADADTIISRLNDFIRRGRMFFLVATLEYLQRGGRIGGAKALLGELLQIKPILTIREGQVEPFEQQRTQKRALARLVEIVEEGCPKTQDAHLCVMQGDAEEMANRLSAELKSRMNMAEIPIYELPPAIITHGGPGAMAVGFFAMV